MMAALTCRVRRRAWLSVLGWLSMPSAAMTLPPPAYQLAAHDAGVPSVVLFAVALQESGTRLQGRLIPWPWTLNVAGTARRYRTRAAACRALRAALPIVGDTHVDVGLAQVNLGYQRQRFADPCEALDPYRNLGAAAAILREQHVTGEDWLVAVGRYHRPAGGAMAARYRRQVAARLAHVLDTARP